MHQSDGRIIFRAEKPYVFDDIVAVLKRANINAGDTLMVHADLKTFGKLADIRNKSEYVDQFIRAFLTVLGKKGTLVVPTYSYSFCNHQIFDPETSPSHVGIFTEELRKRTNAHRSLHPIFSVAAVGSKAKQLTTHLSKSSFGKGSIFHKLAQTNNAKYVIFGVNYFACTQQHYLEEILDVPYRYHKTFSGLIRQNGHLTKKTCDFFVRFLRKRVNPDFSKFEQALEKQHLITKVPLGKGFIQTVKINDLCEVGLRNYRHDPYFFLKNIPKP